MSLTDTERRRGVPCFASRTPESVTKKSSDPFITECTQPKNTHFFILSFIINFIILLLFFLTLISNPAIHYVKKPVCVAERAYLDISLFVCI